MSIKTVKSASDRAVMAADFANLSVDALYDHVTKPALITKWWPSAAEIDLQVGGSYHFSWPQMDWHLRGMYQAAEANQFLAFTWKWDHEPDLPARDVNVVFHADQNGGSSLVIVHGFYSESEQDQTDRQGHIDGWMHFLGELQKV